ncbi:hypothetical protein BH11BAC3_BH11BAC3_46480 [soil metagenome]
MDSKKTAQTMQAHIAACKASGITVKAYCLQHDINHSNYYYWQKKLQPQLPPGKFISITPQLFNTRVTIVFTNGNRMIFEAMPPAEYIKQLMA